MASDNNIAIKVENVSKSFKLPHEKQSSVKGLFVNMFRGKRTYETQEVLKNISFEVKKGEFFGIVGRNGSGKSTLLKLLAGIYTPDKGRIDINGKLTPFIELGVGFNPELTGRENVFLNGSLLGFKRSEVAAMYDEIVGFAELEKFMDQKLKNYSSGMQVRLAFSIAIKAKGDILVLDEVLAVGDEAFQKKCNDYFTRIKKENRTVVLVSHNMDAIRRFCDRVLLVEHGKRKLIGSPETVSNQYILDNFSTTDGSQPTGETQLQGPVKKLAINPISKQSVKQGDDFEFEIEYQLGEDVEVDLGISVLYNGQSMIEHNTKDLELKHKKNKLYKLRYRVPTSSFNNSTLGVDVAIFKRENFELIGFRSGSCSFIVRSDEGKRGGLLKHRGEWIRSW